MSPILEGLKLEAKTIPWTVISLVSLWLCAWAASAYYVMEIEPQHEAAHSAAISAQKTAVEVSVKVTRIERSLLEQRIFETKIKQCGAENVEGRRFYQEKVQELLSEFHDLTGDQYPLPDCSTIQ